MSKPTVASLKEELDKLKETAGNIQLSQFTVWNWEQVAVELEKYDRYGEMYKMEVTRDFHLSNEDRCYHVAIWHRPLMNREDRNLIKGDYYQELRDTKQNI